MLILYHRKPICMILRPSVSRIFRALIYDQIQLGQGMCALTYRVIESIKFHVAVYLMVPEVLRA